MVKKIIFAVLLIGLGGNSHAQFINPPGGKTFTKVELPFDYVNGFIVLEVTFNHIFPLRFILDTGAEHTILTKREYADLMGIPFEREFRIIGSDMSQDLKAHLIRDIHLQTGKLALPNQSMVVMEEDYFRFEEYTGVNVHGIIGANIFRHFVMKIDYQRELITLTKPIDFEAPKGYEKIPLEVYKNKPYIFSQIEMPDGEIVDLKLLLDTGASLTLILHNGTDESIQPPPGVIPGNIGKGLGGFLEGFVGRSRSLNLGPFGLNNIITNYQELNPEMDTSYLNSRNGIVGNLALRRFTVIIDYFRGELYLKPNRYYDEEFKYDRSGMQVIATGKRLSSYLVSTLLHVSPAGESGLQLGDEILKINGISTNLMGLNGISRKLSQKAGKKIKLKILRDGKRMKIRFVLRDLI